MQGLVPPVVRLDARAHEVRAAVRDFLRKELRHTAFIPSSDAWLSGWDEAFSRRLGECGWIGMTIPERRRMAELAFRCFHRRYDMRENAKAIIRLFGTATVLTPTSVDSE